MLFPLHCLSCVLFDHVLPIFIGFVTLFNYRKIVNSLVITDGSMYNFSWS